MTYYHKIHLVRIKAGADIDGTIGFYSSTIDWANTPKIRAGDQVPMYPSNLRPQPLRAERWWWR